MQDTNNNIIYLDYNATTPIHEKVAEVMIPYLTRKNLHGNPSSSHWFGIQAKKAVETARDQVAVCIGADGSDEIIFTSGGTESNNFAIKGLVQPILFSHPNTTYQIITSTIEHPSVIQVFKFLAEMYPHTLQVQYIPVNQEGIIELHQLEQMIQRKDVKTLLVSVMHSNNETGAIQPISFISKLLSQQPYKIYLHTDASQSIGKVPIQVNELQVDLLTICSHKFYGPKGIGALYIKRGTPLSQQLQGADHEMKFRPGTENVLEVVGLGQACHLVHLELQSRKKHMEEMRNLLEEKLRQVFPTDEQMHKNGPQEKQLILPNTLNISFPNVEANRILSEMGDFVAASAGAACHSGGDVVNVSSTLRAMQVPNHIAMGTIRLSTGIYTTKEEIEKAAQIISSTVLKLRPSTLQDENLSTAVEQEELKHITPENVKLTNMTKGLGCGCKLRPQDLANILKQIPSQAKNPAILVGTETSDDAGVYLLRNDLAIVQTVDFFTPICDHPYDFGRIAAANALSDVYAMGGTPLCAMNLVMFPSARLPLSILQKILEGAQTVAQEAQCYIIGGHSIDDNEPKFGMSVTGQVHPQLVWTNSGAQEGDVLCLTKPLGTGLVTTALKRKVISNDSNSELIHKTLESMALLNKNACQILQSMQSIDHKVVNMCTDVTGFGLLGHLKEVVIGSSVEVELFAKDIPLLDEQWIPKLASISQCVSGGTQANFEFTKEVVQFDASISQVEKVILNDAQTSGGLLFSIPNQLLQQVKLEFAQQQVPLSIIGRVTRKTTTPTIHVKNNHFSLLVDSH